MFNFSIRFNDKKFQASIAYLKQCSNLDKLLEEIQKIEKTLQATIVIARKELGMFRRFLQIACTNAVEDFHDVNKRITKRLSIEIIVNLAGTRQINDAINKIVPRGENEGIAIIVSESLEKNRDVIKFLEKTAGCVEVDHERIDKEKVIERIVKICEISETELNATYAEDLVEAVEKCLISRNAMISISK